jgi:hypothetical protein
MVLPVHATMYNGVFYAIIITRTSSVYNAR